MNFLHEICDSIRFSSARRFLAICIKGMQTNILRRSIPRHHGSMYLTCIWLIVLCFRVYEVSSRRSKTPSEDHDTHPSNQRPSYVLASLAPVAPCVLSERAILVVATSGRILERRWSEDTGWGWVQHGFLPGGEQVLRLKCASLHAVFALTASRTYSHSSEADIKAHVPCLQVPCFSAAAPIPVCMNESHRPESSGGAAGGAQRHRAGRWGRSYPQGRRRGRRRRQQQRRRGRRRGRGEARRRPACGQAVGRGRARPRGVPRRGPRPAGRSAAPPVASCAEGGRRRGAASPARGRVCRQLWGARSRGRGPGVEDACEGGESG